MTSTPVMSPGASYFQTTPSSKTNQANQSYGTDFKDFMNNMNSTDKGTASKVDKKDTNEPLYKDSSSSPTDKKDVSEVTTSASKGKKEVTEKNQSDIEESIEKCMKVIEDEFEVSQEELLLAMQNIGLTPIELLNPDNLVALAVELSGADDVMEVATNEELYQSLGNVTQSIEAITNELAGELDVTNEELTEAIKNLPKTEQSSKTQEQQIATPFDGTKALDDELTDFASAISEVRENRSENENQQPVTVDEQLTSATEKTVDQNIIKNQPNQNASDSKQGENSNSDAGKNQENQLSFLNQLINKTAEVLNERFETTTYTTIDAADVIKQIMDTVKVDLNSEVSEINLKLHPEHLGTVSVKVSANNEGVLTASFIAQNENVRAIIESQAVVLKENLNNQGITVEAVEVSVASHQFERNLSDQNRGNNQESEKKRGPRRISLDDAMTEELTNDEDKLAAEIMKQNGNTIDYIA